MEVLQLLQKLCSSIRRHHALFGFRGVMHRAICAIFSINRNFEARIPLSREKVMVRLGTTDVDAFEQVFINREYQFECTHSARVIIDAGANVGMSSAFFSLCYPLARIVAIEPDPSNFEILRENAKRFPNIEPMNVALWSHDSDVLLSAPDSGHWGVRVVREETTDATKVRARSLSGILAEKNIAKVDILKVDIEGSELELFRDPSLWIDKIDFICAELHDRFHPGCSSVFEAATPHFTKKWRQGELVCVAR